jgi:hypothetical protein
MLKTVNMAKLNRYRCMDVSLCIDVFHRRLFPLRSPSTPTDWRELGSGAAGTRAQGDRKVMLVLAFGLFGLVQPSLLGGRGDDGLFGPCGFHN